MKGIILYLCVSASIIIKLLVCNEPKILHVEWLLLTRHFVRYTSSAAYRKYWISQSRGSISMRRWSR